MFIMPNGLFACPIIIEALLKGNVEVEIKFGKKLY